MYQFKTKGLKLSMSNGLTDTFYIFRGKKWTPTYTCMEYSKYYEIANWDFYIRIDKNTMEVTSDRKHVGQFEFDPAYKAEIINLKNESSERMNA